MPDPEVAFEPLADDEIGPFLVATRRRFIGELVAAGDAEDDAARHADSNYDRLFPNGKPAVGQLVGRVTAAGRPIGTLWLGLAGSDPTKWWVYNIEIDEAGAAGDFGRAAMLLAERTAHEQGGRRSGSMSSHATSSRALVYVSRLRREHGADVEVTLIAARSDRNRYFRPEAGRDANYVVHMALVVQKFGGTSVADADRIREVAKHVACTTATRRRADRRRLGDGQDDR